MNREEMVMKFEKGEIDLFDIIDLPAVKEYCTQNGSDCSTCSLSNYGRDCLNIAYIKNIGV